ncbi:MULTISPECIES: biotin carboxylase N-terminal domain-containing protein [unclassified Modestobacter]|uniref:biotin carboxylase N-terminal domain-containing protein n=1 Tax=unclassified Modestobacter TaxID=2643866 RepID=UPI0022AAC5E7|nr:MULTISPECIES: biotin carboxylase N-terminal domain-containing protein [unclassified Modestobacter]MCZ2823915.1 carbamoyl-phosphate-synthetase [Modestobacter sp. VKM Ac-2981]MCZ2852160.1 carbamoyl-phosphate-synthetase [Modestobacter sp. VKM Ac-2982]
MVQAVDSVLVAGRGPMACAVIRACGQLGVKAVAVHSEAERNARHVRMADESVLLGPAPAAESYLDVRRLVEAARRTRVDAVLPVPPALAGNARLAAAVADAGLGWVGPEAGVLERLGGDGVEPASERGFLAWVSAEGLHHVTPVLRDRAGGTPRVSWTPPDGLGSLPAAARRLPELGWRGLVTVGIDPGGELAEVAAGFSLDIAVLERAHGLDAVALALGRVSGAPAGGLPDDAEGPPYAGLAVQLRSTLPPGTEGRVTGRLPDVRPQGGRVAGDTELVAVSGYDEGDRLDGWYDALLATVSAAGPDAASAARVATEVLTGLPETGVPHDGPAVCTVLRRIAGALVPGCS